MYCPECGEPNPEDARFCKECGKALPESIPTAGQAEFGESAPSTPQTKAESLNTTWWQGLAPDWRAALLVTVFIIVLGLIGDLVPGLGFLLSIPFMVFIYYIQGVLTGKYARSNPSYKDKKYFLLGARSGIWTSVVFGIIFTLITLAIQFTFTLGTALALIPLIISQSLLDIFLNVSFSALGAWLYKVLGGTRMILISIGVIGCGTILAVGIVLAVLIVLVYLGIFVYKDIINASGLFSQALAILAIIQ